MVAQAQAPLINIGAGEDLSIAELAALVADVIGFGGEFVYDASKPDGTPRKLLDVSRMLALGWKPRVELREGIALAKQRGAYRGRKKSLSSERIAELRQRVEAGEQKTKLAREFGISRETLYQYLRTDQ